MFKTMKKLLIAVVLLGVLIPSAAMASRVQAAESNVQYRGRAERFVFIPADTDLFVNFKNVMPGDVLEQKILVQNESTNIMPVRIYLRAEPTNPADKPFLEQMQLRVDQTSRGTLSDSTADLQGGLADNVLLGTFFPGMTQELDVSLDVPTSMGNDFQNAIADVVWVFTVEEDDPPPLPQTGLTANQVRKGIILVLAGVALILVLIVRRRQGAKHV